MCYDVNHRFIMFPHRTIKKNALTLILVFPTLGILVFLFSSPFNATYPTVHTSYGIATGSNRKPFVKDPIQPNRTYRILVWNHGKRMERRFLRSYGETNRDPFEFCSVSNCDLTTDDSQISTADAVLFHLHQTKGPWELPKIHRPEQIWIFFTDESPLHTFYASRKFSMKDYNGLFNWSMTFRKDSDIPIPYGRTVPLDPKEQASAETLPNFAELKNMTVAVLGSNCGGHNYRWQYVDELKKHIKVDVYGGCGSLNCPGHFTRDCKLINKYKFYLAFENSNCKEYMTEKLWWNAFQKEAIPVVMGSPKKDYEELCPPHSFIHVGDYSSPAELARYLEYLDKNDTAYNEYFKWKAHFKVLNEHGYFGSPSLHLCRICEKLNAKISKPKIYNDLQSFWNSKTDCYKPDWIPNNLSLKKRGFRKF